jgi:iron complex transport system substrate-binding protein
MKDNLIRFVSMLAVPLLLLFYFTFINTNRGNPFDPPQRLPRSQPQRIISFAPSVTEILFELGVGGNVVGVTQFCNYPPEAAERKKIGGHVDHNYEAILRLKPDFAVILRERRDIMAFLDRHSIHYITVGSESLDEIIDAIELISRACFVPDRGEALALRLRRQLADASAWAAANKTRHTGDDGSPAPAGITPPRVLFCVGRDDIGSGTVTKVFAAGASSFYAQLIEALGGVNVLNDVEQAYPAISTEAIVRLDPDIIIDISSAYLRPTPERICGDWRSLKSVTAVNTGGVYCLSGDYLTIPGPRFGLILEDIKKIFASRMDAR